MAPDGPGGLGGALEVVEDAQQVECQGADGVEPVGVGPGGRLLAEVGELGARALELVEVVVALLPRLLEVVRRGLAGRRGRLGLGVVGALAHRSPFLRAVDRLGRRQSASCSAGSASSVK